MCCKCAWPLIAIVWIRHRLEGLRILSVSLNLANVGLNLSIHTLLSSRWPFQGTYLLLVCFLTAPHPVQSCQYAAQTDSPNDKKSKIPPAMALLVHCDDAWDILQAFNPSIVIEWTQLRLVDPTMLYTGGRPLGPKPIHDQARDDHFRWPPIRPHVLSVGCVS